MSPAFTRWVLKRSWKAVRGQGREINRQVYREASTKNMMSAKGTFGKLEFRPVGLKPRIDRREIEAQRSGLRKWGIWIPGEDGV
jgi:hypothetical protein